MKYTKNNSRSIHGKQNWSKNPSGDIVTKHIEGLIKTEIELIDSYDIVRVDENTLYCLFTGERNIEHKTNNYSSFQNSSKSYTST